MDKKMNETEILLRFDNALKERHIVPYFQPQFNHATGRMIGAEALMRWIDPDFGMQSPVDFIPVFENYRLIHRADLSMVKQICRSLRKWLDAGLKPVPISFNISRFDIYMHDFVAEIESIRRKYGIPVELLRAEITESSAIGGMELVTDLLKRLHECGYIVEMDDFGSGSSSLNMLKLDMRFLSGDLTGRGGTIISSIVQMAKRLNAATIAEGVETVEQADYMKSIGCSCVQGYLYSKPIDGEAFTALLGKTGGESLAPAFDKFGGVDAMKFWTPETMEALIFSHYVGAAAIFSYDLDSGAVEILRVNPKYIKELGMNLTEEEIIHSDPWENHDEESHREFDAAIRKAIDTGEEVECENWRRITSRCCGDDLICVRSDIQVIGKAGKEVVIYSMVRNITAEKKRSEAIKDSATFFGFLADQVNAYAWEYDIDTKRMHPCARCRRDLGLPELLENYPEPVIESGLFPQDYADMYRDWHRQLENGVESLEATIPLTPDRIPFRVRYTNVFDENGRPLKAYGSAALITEND